MKKISNEELQTIMGGIDFTGAMISSLVRGIKTLLDFGRSIGTAIRRVSENKLCPVL